ncbi:thioredoxin family protein [Magnetococcus sp. PR-3]|uniref:thioredoxin family protein n=1 Tax=Magnetococcus sp. PR-3 TaxID=3120355 RepID=UPI002FCE61DE
MKHIMVLGSGCKSCKTTCDLIEMHAERLGVEIDLHHSGDPDLMRRYQMRSMPGVVVDHTLVHCGGLPDQEDIEAWLQDDAC